MRTITQISDDTVVYNKGRVVRDLLGNVYKNIAYGEYAGAESGAAQFGRTYVNERFELTAYRQLRSVRKKSPPAATAFASPAVQLSQMSRRTAGRQRGPLRGDGAARGRGRPKKPRAKQRQSRLLRERS